MRALASRPASPSRRELAFEDISHRFGPDAETLRRRHARRPSRARSLCLLGPSGCGKTTLLRIAAGIEPQSAGRVLINEREIAGPSVFLPPEQRAIGLMFQDFALFPHLTILDNVTLRPEGAVARGGASARR